MAEYSKEKLYFLKLPKDFFMGHQMRILESLPSGKEFELIYLKLMVESISYRGYLRYSEEVPYTEDMIAAITNSTPSTVGAALIALERLGLVVRNENDSIFIPAVPEMTGVTTEGAQRKKLQRGTKGGQEGDKCPPEYRYKSLENRDKKYIDNDKRSAYAHKEDEEDDGPF